MNDGGTAFPIEHQEDARGNVRAPCQPGMSVRDYFAIHGGEPLQVDLLDAAGMTQRPDGIYAKGTSTAPVALSFNAWFGALTSDQRFTLRAQVRFSMADAMLQARAA